MREHDFESVEVPITQQVSCRIVDPAGSQRTDRARPVLLALHGMGMNGSTFHHILRHLDVTEMIVVIPDAIHAYEDRSNQPPKILRSWYHYDGDQPGFRAGLELAESHLLRILDQVEETRLVDRRRSVVLGFSQGGYLAGFVGTRHPDRFGGVVIASARLKHEFVEAEVREHPPTMLFVHSERDLATPLAAVEAGRDLVVDAGGDAELALHHDGHRLPPDALAEVGLWLGQHGFDAGQSERRQLDKVWRLIDSGEPERAVELSRKLLETSLGAEAALACGVAHLDHDHPHAAVKMLDAIDPARLDGDAEFLRRFHIGQALWEIGEPSRALDALSPLEPDDPIERANLEWWRGLCYDAEGKTERANRLFSAAHELDPDGAPPVSDISPDDALKIVEHAVRDLPDRVRSLLDEVPIVIEDLPALELVRNSKGSVRPDTLGLYTGTAITERSNLDGGLDTATIQIFRRNLERFARDREELEEQIRVTLLHELGHHLGYDEDQLDELGLA